MTYAAIESFSPINPVENDKVNQLAKSMLANGWQGAPILYTDYMLITGSHRLEALREIEKMYVDDEITYPSILDEDIALDVTEIINDYCKEEEITIGEIDFSDIGKIFEGTEVEQWKDEIEEW